MKLIYNYIQDFYTLKKANFNFGGKFIFEFNEESQALKCTINEYYMPDFFDIISPEERQSNFAYVRNIGAIVGENGTGKSTYLEYIKNNFIEGTNGFKTVGIIALEDYNSQKTIVYVHDSLQINQRSRETLKDFDIDIRVYRTRRVKIHTKSLKKVFSPYAVDSINEVEKISYIYYSNIFDKRLEVELSGLYNISTNFLLREDGLKEIEKGKQIHPSQMVNEHRFKEVEREICFISNFKNQYTDFLSFSLPEFLYVSIAEPKDVKNDELIFESKLSQFLSSFEEYYTSKIASSKGKKYLAIKLAYGIITNFFYEYYKYSSAYILGFESFEYKSNINFDRDFIKTYISIIEFTRQKLSANGFDGYDKKLTSCIEVIDKFLKILPDEDPLIDEKLSAFQVNIDESSQQVAFFNFFEAYRETYEFEPNLNFNWRDLSTGEKALLTIYSRLFYLSDNIIYKRGANLLLETDIVLLIDEGESHLHPSWQKELLFNLLKILPIIFKREKEIEGKLPRNIQVILTSNSPLIITDIPASNIVFLNKKNGNVVTQNGLNENLQTFAANIHTLLSDSFFMQNGTIGNLATQKINDIIKDLRATYYIAASRRNEIRKTIQQIGEPIIKHKLMQLYDERFNLDIHERLDRIEGILGLEND